MVEYVEDILLEKLSSLEHEQWIFWSKGLAGSLARYCVVMYDLVNKYTGEDYTKEEMDNLINDLWNVHGEITSRLIRWDDLYKPYNELSEEFKEDDRVHARKVIELLKAEKIL